VEKRKIIKKKRREKKLVGLLSVQCTLISCDRALTMTVQRVAADPRKQP